MQESDRAGTYLHHSVRWERGYTDLLARLDAIAAGRAGAEWSDLTATERANVEPIAAQARGKVQRILQARQIVRHMQERPLPQNMAALNDADLWDHALALQDAHLVDCIDA